MSRVPPHASGSPPPPRATDLEQLEELGDDAIIAQQLGAHSPQPRAQVTEEARSVVISEHPGAAAPSSDPRAPGNSSRPRRSERTEKTVVIRDRRQVDELRRQMEQRRERQVPAQSNQALLMWVMVGVAAFLAGGLLALFATRDEGVSAPPAHPAPSAVQPPPSRPAVTNEPPSVSIDELPIERK